MQKQVTAPEARRLQERYWQVKRLLEFAVNGDFNNEVHRELRDTLTLEQIQTMQFFLEQCEDWGIHRIKRRLN